MPPLRFETGVPAGSPTVTVDGVSLAYDRQGAGPPVVCLSAIQHGARDFDALAAKIGQRFEVIRLDWPGHGRSGDDTQPASAARYGQLLAGALEQLEIRDPILVGNSIGGAAAVHAATRRAADGSPVRAVVLCDSGGLVAVNDTARRFCGVFARFFAAGERGAGWFGPVFAAYYRLLVLPQAAARDQRRRIIASAYETAPVARQAWESFGQPDADIRGLLRGLGVPIWAAWGADDRVVPLGLCREALEAAPGASISTFAAGHAAFLEQPEAFAQAFLAFAEGLAVSRPAARAA
jgi:4,5:9,10-diseco-3-hydroxy-5,9,17-trioxoandrosta-1(10),2-diene-4-oate hydrolase